GLGSGLGNGASAFNLRFGLTRGSGLGTLIFGRTAAGNGGGISTSTCLIFFSGWILRGGSGGGVTSGAGSGRTLMTGVTGGSGRRRNDQSTASSRIGATISSV